jgi:hypothetical protein
MTFSRRHSNCSALLFKLSDFYLMIITSVGFLALSVHNGLFFGVRKISAIIISNHKLNIIAEFATLAYSLKKDLVSHCSL